MIFSDEFIDEFRADPVAKAIEVKSIIKRRLSEGNEWRKADLDVLMEGYALLAEALEANLLPLSIDPPNLSGDLSHDCLALNSFINDIEETCIVEASRLKLESLRSRFKTSLGSAFSYEFSQGDLERVQLLVNNLRAEISGLNGLESDHKQRLLRRLEKLQSELHKKMSDLDRFWGLVGDAGVVLGKLGNDAKPIVDRIREIADIVWQTQSRAEELPSGTQLPSLENKSQPHDGQD